MGSYRCLCKDGYTGDGFTCTGRLALETAAELLLESMTSHIRPTTLFLRLGHASQVTEMTAYLRLNPHGMKPWRQVTKRPSKS